MNNNRRIAEWAGWKREDDKGEWWSVPGFGRKPKRPDLGSSNAIVLWHSTLFPLIEERGMACDFVDNVTLICRGQSVITYGTCTVIWRALTATPAQLVEALVRAIKEG